MDKEKSKKPMKPRVRAVLAAAAAVCLVGAITGIVFLVKAGIAAITDNGGVNYGNSPEIGEKPPIELKGGKLYFTADGQNTDITNMVDRDLPYIYPCTDTETGAPAYIIAGGDTDSYGFIKIVWSKEYEYWYGNGRTLDRAWLINVSVDEHYYSEPHYEDRWYLVNDTLSFGIQYNCALYTIDEEGEVQWEMPNHTHMSAYGIPGNWQEECPDAWVISALLKLELFEMPKKMDTSLLSPVKLTDGRVIFTAEGQETDITALISEDTPYVYKVKNGEDYSEDYDSYILAGGNPTDLGWVLVCRAKNGMWIAKEENITYIADAMGGENSERFRPWYLNGVEEIGYDKGQLYQSRTAIVDSR